VTRISESPAAAAMAAFPGRLRFGPGVRVGVPENVMKKIEFLGLPKEVIPADPVTKIRKL
jgi:hypothetical protein